MRALLDARRRRGARGGRRAGDRRHAPSRSRATTSGTTAASPWNEALAAAAAEVRRPRRSSPFVSADLPLLRADEVEELLAATPAARNRDRARARRRHERGLDAAAGLVRTRFGEPGSAAVHAGLGVAHVVVDLPGPRLRRRHARRPRARCRPHAAEARLQGVGRAVRAAPAARPLGARPSGSGWRSSASPTTSSRSATPAATAPAVPPLARRPRRAHGAALLGTSVLTPTMRYHPSMIAQAFATLACLNPGRIWLGVGTGESLNETPATGAEWPGAKERRLRLAEAIELMRRLWTDERVTFEGEYYRTEKATIYDRPDEPVPIYVAASGPARGEARRPRRRRLHHDQRQGARALRGADRGDGGGRAGGRPRPGGDRPDDRDQGLVRPRPRVRARGLRVLGAARADARAEAGRRGPDRAGAARRREPRRSPSAASSSPTTPTRSSSGSATTSSSASTTSSSTRRATTSALPRPVLPPTSCRGCESASEARSSASAP